jgi:hypothetical protein
MRTGISLPQTAAMNILVHLLYTLLSEMVPLAQGTIGPPTGHTMSCYLRVLYKFAYNDNTIIRERILASP